MTNYGIIDNYGKINSLIVGFVNYHIINNFGELIGEEYNSINATLNNLGYMQIYSGTGINGVINNHNSIATFHIEITPNSILNNNGYIATETFSNNGKINNYELFTATQALSNDGFIFNGENATMTLDTFLDDFDNLGIIINCGVIDIRFGSLTGNPIQPCNCSPTISSDTTNIGENVIIHINTNSTVDSVRFGVILLA